MHNSVIKAMWRTVNHNVQSRRKVVCTTHRSPQFSFFQNVFFFVVLSQFFFKFLHQSMCGKLPFWQDIFVFVFKLSLLFLTFICFTLPRCCWSFVLFLSFLSFPVSSGLLYFSWELGISLYLFILEGSDSLVRISGLHPLPGWGPPKDNNVYSSRPGTAEEPSLSLFPSPTLQLAVRIGKFVAWESWARFVRTDTYAWCTPEWDTLALSIERWWLLSISSGHPSGTGPIFCVFFYGE